VSLLVGALAVAGAIVVGGWIARTMRGRAAREGADAGEQAQRQAVRDPLAGFLCKLGDVVLRRSERDEAWLAGALVFEEERPVAVLFVAPEVGVDRALFVRDGGGADLTWLARIAGEELPVARDPPHTLEHAGTRFERVRRLPMKVSRMGTGTPNVGAQAIVAEYVGPGADRLVVVAGVDQTLAWRGVAVAEGEYEVLPGGKATLEG